MFPPLRRPYVEVLAQSPPEGAISEAKAAELLGHSVHELNRRMDEPPSLEAELAGA